MKGLKQKGCRPDVILAHPEWGETLFVKDVYPDIPLIHFCEYYYHSKSADVGFDPEFPCAPDASSRIRPQNSMHLLNLEQCDIGIAPTHWQRSLFPTAYHSKIHVIHEGIALQAPELLPIVSVRLPSGHVLEAGQPVVTYVARNLEPYRGFHSFMRSIPYIQAECPDAQIVIVGGDGVSYGCMPKGFENWRSKLLAELKIDLSTVHFTGRLPYKTYRAVLQVSEVHVYLTYPFVMSWSLLEAMASECVVIGSDTAPVWLSPSQFQSTVAKTIVECGSVSEWTELAAQETPSGKALRNSLKHLSEIVIERDDDFAGRGLELHDSKSGDGVITEQWIVDRADMLGRLISRPLCHSEKTSRRPIPIQILHLVNKYQ